MINNSEQESEYVKKLNDIFQNKKSNVKNNFKNMETFETLTEGFFSKMKKKKKGKGNSSPSKEASEENPPLSNGGNPFKAIKGKSSQEKLLTTTKTPSTTTKTSSTTTKTPTPLNKTTPSNEPTPSNELTTEATSQIFNGSSSERWKKAFAFLTKLKPSDFMSLKGIQAIFRLFFYIYPIFVELIAYDITEGTPTMEYGMSEFDYNLKKKSDREMIIHSGAEFGYVLVAMYVCHMMYCRLHDMTPPLRKCKEYMMTGNSALDTFVQNFVMAYLYFAPDALHFFSTTVLKRVVTYAGVDEYPTLKIFFIFLVSYYIVYYNLGFLAKMFLDALDYKANPSMYLYIFFGWVFFIGSVAMPGNFLVQKIIMMSPFAFAAMVIIHFIMTLLMFAPIGQLVLVVYTLFCFFGSPMDMWNVVIGLWGKNSESVVNSSYKSTLESVMSDKTSLKGGFDNFAFMYGYRFFFFFILLLFFAFKTIQSGVELQLLTVQTVITTTNAYITATLLVIFAAFLYFDKGISDEDVEFLKDVLQKRKSTQSRNEKSEQKPGNSINGMMGQLKSGNNPLSSVMGMMGQGQQSGNNPLSSVMGMMGQGQQHTDNDPLSSMF